MDKLSDEAVIYACAFHAHETNRVFLSAVDPGRVLDPSWTELAAKGDPEVNRMVRMVRFVVEDDGTAERKHGQWCLHMFAQGWTKGPGPDPENMKHPMLVPWAELPHTQAMKEALVVASINAMATALGHSRRPMQTATVETKPGG